MPDNNDDIDSRRRRHQCRGNRRSDPARFGRRQSIDTLDRTTDSAHNIRALERDFIGDGCARALEDGARLLSGHRQFHKSALHDLDDGLCGHVTIERWIGIRLFEGDDLRVAITTISRNDNTRTGIVYAIGERFVAEPTEHGRVNDTETLTGFGPEQLFRNVRHVDRDSITRVETEIS